MGPELAVAIPTRGRPENIRKVISAWDFTNAWDVADMVLVADADDPEIERYRALQEETRHPDTDEPLFRLIEMDRWMPMVHKLDAVAREYASGREGPYFALGFAGDDHLPRTINWAQTYLAELHAMGTGLVHGDDGFQHANVCTEWAVTADVVRALGRMIPAPVEHMWSDVSLHEVMTGAGALRYLPQVRIEHMHPIVKKAENDEQYQRVNSREQFRRDGNVYHEWQRRTRALHIDHIRALLPEPQRRQAARPERKRRMLKMPWPSHFKQVRGATPDEIGLTLADFAMSVPADQEIVELGVFQGRTALQMAWGARQGQGAHLTAIDAWDLEGNTYGPPFTDPGSMAWARHWVRNFGYNRSILLVQAFSQDVAEKWPDESVNQAGGKPIGLLFVDADHSYEGARGDIEVWAPHLAPGAIIAVDDYGHPDWPGVAQAVDALVAEGVLEPVTIYHERLAVTKLTERQEWATTGHAAEPIGEPMTHSPVPAGKADTVAIGEAETVSLDEPDPVDDLFDVPVVDAEESIRETVQKGELPSVAAGTSIATLNLGQLRALARYRLIRLGARKDLKADILQALRDGR